MILLHVYKAYHYQAYIRGRRLVLIVVSETDSFTHMTPPPRWGKGVRGWSAPALMLIYVYDICLLSKVEEQGCEAKFENLRGS